MKDPNELGQTEGCEFPESDEIASTERSHLWPPFSANRDLESIRPCYVRRHGAIVNDICGRQYVDLATGALCSPDSALGLAIISALSSQLRMLPKACLCMGSHPQAVALSARIAKLCGGSLTRCFFGCSGSEAIETALKIARGYHYCRGEVRPAFAALEGSWHGATLGALGVSLQREDREGFGPFPAEVLALPVPMMNGDVGSCLTKARNCIMKYGPAKIAAIFAEPVMSVAGMLPLPIGFLRGLREICNEYGILLVFDEILCGCGRTGEFLAHGQSGIQPDICTLGKNLTADFLPLSCTVTTDVVFSAFQRDPSGGFRHGHNYSAYPAGCAAANVVLRKMSEGDLLEKIRSVGGQFLDALIHMNVGNIVKYIRTQGLMIGLELADVRNGWTQFAAHARACGLLLRSSDHRLHLLPPADICSEEIHMASVRLEHALLSYWSEQRTCNKGSTPCIATQDNQE